jgi:ribulose-phosphate 3-epimerase
MNRIIKIAPSILSADFSRLGEEVEAAEEAGADFIHLDVMDGRFVPNITFGPALIKGIRGRSALPFDTHLMIESPERFVDDFGKAGADILTVQVEACPHLQRVLSQIRQAGMKSGVAVNPATPVDFLPYVLDVTDLVLVMTVNPGFGGQSFINGVAPKIARVREMIDRSGREILLEVDGGVNPETAGVVIGLGADLLVAGSAIFGTKNYRESIGKIRGAGAGSL